MSRGVTPRGFSYLIIKFILGKKAEQPPGSGIHSSSQDVNMVVIL
jgi:hypothetical protein